MPVLRVAIPGRVGECWWRTEGRGGEVSDSMLMRVRTGAAAVAAGGWVDIRAVVVPMLGWNRGSRILMYGGGGQGRFGAREELNASELMAPTPPFSFWAHPHPPTRLQASPLPPRDDTAALLHDYYFNHDVSLTEL